MKPSHPKPLPPRAAFSLIELLAVLALLVALMALAVPAFNNAMGGMHVTLAAQKVAEEILHANAVSQSRNPIRVPPGSPHIAHDGCGLLPL